MPLFRFLSVKKRRQIGAKSRPLTWYHPLSFSSLPDIREDASASPDSRVSTHCSLYGWACVHVHSKYVCACVGYVCVVAACTFRVTKHDK